MNEALLGRLCEVDMPADECSQARTAEEIAARLRELVACEPVRRIVDDETYDSAGFAALVRVLVMALSPNGAPLPSPAGVRAAQEAIIGASHVAAFSAVVKGPPVVVGTVAEEAATMAFGSLVEAFSSMVNADVDTVARERAFDGIGSNAVAAAAQLALLECHARYVSEGNRGFGLEAQSVDECLVPAIGRIFRDARFAADRLMDEATARGTRTPDAATVAEAMRGYSPLTFDSGDKPSDQAGGEVDYATWRRSMLERIAATFPPVRGGKLDELEMQQRRTLLELGPALANLRSAVRENPGDGGAYAEALSKIDCVVGRVAAIESARAESDSKTRDRMLGVNRGRIAAAAAQAAGALISLAVPGRLRSEPSQFVEYARTRQERVIGAITAAIESQLEIEREAAAIFDAAN